MAGVLGLNYLKKNGKRLMSTWMLLFIVMILVCQVLNNCRLRVLNLMGLFAHRC